MLTDAILFVKNNYSNTTYEFLIEYFSIKISEQNEVSEILQNNDFFLIIIDNTLHLQEKINLYHQIRSRKNYSKVPIFFIVTNEDEADIDKLITLDDVDFIVTPLMNKLFVKRLEKQIELLKAKKSLSGRIDFVKKIFNCVPVGIILINKNKEIQIINDYVKKLLNLDRDDYNIKCYSFLQDKVKINECPLSSLNKSYTDSVLKIKLKNKNIFIYNRCARCEINDEEIIVRFITDITERRNVEESKLKLIEEHKNTNIKLKRLMRMKDNFLATASHDLRSPFNGILGFSELLINDPNINDEQLYCVEMIKQSAEMQLSYIDDLLDLLKLESGKMRLKLEKVNIFEVINMSLKTMETIANSKNITIELKEDNIKQYILNIDKVKVAQVLNNLISNAIKFTQTGGDIILKTIFNENCIIIHVIDNGIGIPENFKERVFSEFNQYHESGTEGERGTGLGLAICKKFIELHNGQIGVNSVKGKGSDFYFSLPIKCAAISYAEEIK